MEVSSGPADANAILDAYLQATDEAESDRLLEEILTGPIAASIRKIVAYRLGHANGGVQDIEDTVGEVIIELLRKLQSLRHNDSADPILDLSAFIAGLAHRAVNQYFRERNPERHRLKNKVRYFLRSQSRYALWQTPEGDSVCGFAEWQRQSSPGRLPGDSGLESLRDLPSLLPRLFERTGGPVPLDAVVGFVAALWGVREIVFTVHRHESLSAVGSSPAEHLHDDRRLLERLWPEVLELPVDQRRALLLNLRDGAIGLLPIAGIASIRQIAAALEMPAEELAQIWKTLPLDDLTIASRLGINRQRVINLRMAARKRLGRRMKDIEGGNK
jgi:DNA-directed RNA polymerase specialized sigma24 family protein